LRELAKVEIVPIHTRMTDRPDPPPKSGKDAQNAAREARLAAALRENLKRRKAQTRGRDAGETAEKPRKKG
jgi:hypothetical protein